VQNSEVDIEGLASAKFLEHFTEGCPWAHIDMSSMSLSEEDKPTQPRGATGYGVRLLTTFLEGWGFEGYQFG
jgi:leucyl aminopeptidase